MLPNILDVAQKYDLQFQSKSFGKKESLAKCPFCKEDAGKRRKFYLSLNTEEQLYKCWYCKKAGGVLDFEVQLSGKPYQEIKQNYFGTCRQSLHPAYRLTPYQLERIGWKEYKRNDFRQFQMHKRQILNDWKQYTHEKLALHYAIFLCIAHLENQQKRQQELLVWLIYKCWHATIPNMYNRIQDEYLKGQEQGPKKWAVEGTILGRLAWGTCLETIDFDMDTLFVNIVFLQYLRKTEHKKGHVPITEGVPIGG
ncbi:hypothetical protein [Lentibacillus cibarius]|uniref:Zinc finger CHC2-type domain-containing protein n=1 Tax=Lentibacillus cibarius TaxID=2583219 RepID=A0A5S3QG82_9BACI|nr:hypothetical protein [Lentibacillus cibarius]TMN20905.1 hypothetical protein FFL34_01355 [Lentibacillus cibarius]